MARELLTTAQLSKAIKLQPETIWAKVRGGQIPAITVGGRYRFDYDEVVAALRQPEGARP